MNKLFKNFIYILSLTVAIFAAGCSDDIDDEITSLNVSRLFSPIDLSASLVNTTGVKLTWKAVNKAESYNIQVFNNGDSDFSGTPLKSITDISFDITSYTITGFEGETTYSVRIQAIGSNIGDSKWTSTTFKTGTEQIFTAVDNIEATSATLHWPAGQIATKIVLTPGNKEYTVTSADIAAGSATVTGLTAETKYTATLMNGTKTRGTISFETPVDLNGAIAVYPENDLKAMLDGANNGDVFALFPGNYDLGEYAISKSISITGVRPDNKPVILGRFTFSADITSLVFKTVVLDGTATSQLTNPFETKTACKIGALTLSSSEIRNYKQHLIYNNTSAEFGTITIADCIIKNIVGDGGDGIDFRGGSLATLLVENTTFSTGFRTFMRVQVTSNVTFQNCTFYKVCNFDNSNNTGLFRLSGGTFVVKKCLFAETGVNTYGNFCKSAANMGATATYNNNYYYNCLNLWAGLYTSPASCNATEANPMFTDAPNGNFKVGNDDLKTNNIGDPRWLN